MAAGVAGHNPAVHDWANENLDLDFHMCSYYNPTPRDQNAEHVHGAREVFADGDRAAMVDVIATLRAPAIHYKIFAAGRKDPRDAFAFVAKHLRPQDAVCIGVYPKAQAGYDRGRHASVRRGARRTLDRAQTFSAALTLTDKDDIRLTTTCPYPIRKSPTSAAEAASGRGW